MLIISACLCGINCKYDGSNNLHPYFLELLANGEAIPLCPEQLGGLPTPRPVCEIHGGTGQDLLAGQALAISRQGEDISMALVKGAEEILHLAVGIGVEGLVLQSRSPSCGCGLIYDGTFSHRLIGGDGVTTALLKQHGFQVWNEQDYLRKKGVCTSIESS